MVHPSSVFLDAFGMLWNTLLLNFGAPERLICFMLLAELQSSTIWNLVDWAVLSFSAPPGVLGGSPWRNDHFGLAKEARFQVIRRARACSFRYLASRSKVFGNLILEPRGRHVRSFAHAFGKFIECCPISFCALLDLLCQSYVLNYVFCVLGTSAKF